MRFRLRNVAQFFPPAPLLLVIWCGCSLLNDFDGYHFESQADAQPADPRKPRRDAAAGDSDGGSSELDAELPGSALDGAQAPDDAGDARTTLPLEDAAQGAPEGGARDAAPAPPDGLAGPWQVSLPRRSSTCDPLPPVLELDGWELEVSSPTRGTLRSDWFTLEGTLQTEGGQVVAASFGGDVGEAHYTVELWLGPRGALAGQLTEEPNGAGRCVTTRAVEGVR